MQLKDETSLWDGKYRITRFLSSSDFGYTYEAICTRNDSHVAIREFYLRNCCERHPYNDEVSASSLEKVELFDKMKKRFMDEARALFQFNHPNIVHVIDVFRQNGTAYYVMDYVEGVTLKELVQQKGRLSEEEALTYMDQLCDAINYVHSKNRLHLDIRPANAIISPDGRVNLVDFGFSKRLDPSDNDTNVTSLNVTPNSYSPIELSVDSDATITSVSDIYSLGATLYTLLTGNTPPDAAMLLEYPLEELPSEISPNVALAIKQAMSPNKADRPQSVNDFRRMLHAPMHTSAIAHNNNPYGAGIQNDYETGGSPNPTISNIEDSPYNTNQYNTNQYNTNQYNSNQFVNQSDNQSDNQFDPNSGVFQNENTGLASEDQGSPEATPDKHAETDFSKIDFGFEQEQPQGSERTVIDSHPSSLDNTNNHWGFGANNSSNDNPTQFGSNNQGGYGRIGGDSGLIVEPEDIEGVQDGYHSNYGNDSENTVFGGPDNRNYSEGGNGGNDGGNGGNTDFDASRFDVYANRKIRRKRLTSNTGLTVAIIIATVLVLGVVGYWAYNKYLSAPTGVSYAKSSSSISEGAPGVSLGTYAQNETEQMGELDGHYWVDLGLPSGTKWATTNVGADNPSDFGGYYAWGETDTKDVYNYENAATYEKPMGKIAGNPTFDVATKLWGDSWQIPTKEQYEELLENCTCYWVDVDGVKGGLFKSRKNGQSIFLPAAGFRYGVITSDTDASYVGTEGAYWTDTPVPNDPQQENAYGLRLYGSSIQSIDNKFHRGAGRSIRAVAK